MNLNYDDHAAHHAAFDNEVCRRCGAIGAHFIGPGSGDHYARVICNNCGQGDWLPWPPTLEGRRETKTL